MSVQRGFVCVMLLILPMIYGERCESQDVPVYTPSELLDLASVTITEVAINICSDAVKTGSLLYLDINIQPKDNIDNCSCLLQFIQSDPDETHVRFTSSSVSNWCYYSLTIKNPQTTGRFLCGGTTPTLLFNLRHTETLDILLKKESQPPSNTTRCVRINSDTTNVRISCNKVKENLPTQQPTSITSLPSTKGEDTTTTTQSTIMTTTPTLIFSTTTFRAAISPSSKTSISLMTTNTTSFTALNSDSSTGASTSVTDRESTTTPTRISSNTTSTSAIPPSSKPSTSLMTTNTASFTALTTDSSTITSTSGTGGESTKSSVEASTSVSSTSVEEITKTPSSSYTGSFTALTTDSSTITGTSGTDGESTKSSVEASTSVSSTSVEEITKTPSSSYTRSEETSSETTTLNVAPDGLSDTQVQYIIIGVAAGVVVIIIIVIIVIICIRKKKREKKPSNVPLEHINPGFTDDESDYGNDTIHNNKNTISDENGHYAGVYNSPIAKAQPLPRDDSAEDNQVNHDDLVTDHYTLPDIVTPKPTKQQNVTIGEMGQNKSISSSMNPKHKSKRQPILPVDVKDLYAVVNKPVREVSHESEQSQEGIHLLYAVPNKPKKQQVGDSDTTETRDAIENKVTTEDNKSTLHVNDNTNTHQETSAVETDIPLNSSTDTYTVESTALLQEGITRL